MMLRNNCKLTCSFSEMFKVLVGGVCLMSFILLNGCSTTVRRDGPPPFEVDETQIPDAQPKKEALSKYGNMNLYHVRGQDYYVMKTAKHYHERGVASWYGMMFHKQRTSSGEPYNLLAMTAAHKTLPLPTYVQVTNLANHRKIIVKVNDRGPFAPNRIIDLSYVAAKKLGMLGRGTANVDVVAINPGEIPRDIPLFAQNNSTKYKVIKSGSDNFLQVGAFRNRIYAERLRKRLRPLIASPIEVTHFAHTSKHVYRVKIGPIRDVATTKHITKKLRSIGLVPERTRV